jgi:hypothetical protein
MWILKWRILNSVRVPWKLVIIHSFVRIQFNFNFNHNGHSPVISMPWIINYKWKDIWLRQWSNALWHPIPIAARPINNFPERGSSKFQQNVDISSEITDWLTNLLIIWNLVVLVDQAVVRLRNIRVPRDSSVWKVAPTLTNNEKKCSLIIRKPTHFRRKWDYAEYIDLPSCNISFKFNLIFRENYAPVLNVIKRHFRFSLRQGISK